MSKPNAAIMIRVDHTGVPNSQLVKENARVAAHYKNKSVAEQNSVDMSWNLLMEPQFRDLRNAIYCDVSELTRFRSLLVNAVMATDIVRACLHCRRRSCTVLSHVSGTLICRSTRSLNSFAIIVGTRRLVGTFQ